MSIEDISEESCSSLLIPKVKQTNFQHLILIQSKLCDISSAYSDVFGQKEFSSLPKTFLFLNLPLPYV